MTDRSPHLRILPNRVLSLRIVVLLASLMLLSSCASTPPAPDAAIQAAELAIGNAERDRVAEFSAPELSEARAKLAAAHDAVRQEQMVDAKRLAEQSRADAELASAKADVAKATLVNDEMQKSIDALNQEMQRNTGAGQ